MPGDLRDPEVQPWHYDTRYDGARSPNVTDISPDMDAYIQSIAVECRGNRLTPQELQKVNRKLDESGASHMHPGDEAFRDDVRMNVMARKVATTYAGIR